MRTLVQTIKSIIGTTPVSTVGETDVLRVQGAVAAAFPQLQAELRCTAAPKPGRYLCYQDAELGFVILALVWGPGDSTPIHDHGTWGVEVVLKNQLKVTSYTQCETDPQPIGTQILSAGDVMHNIPLVRDVHKVEHASGDYALSLHIYGTQMTQNRSFIPGRGFQYCPLELSQWSGSALTL